MGLGLGTRRLLERGQPSEMHLFEIRLSLERCFACRGRQGSGDVPSARGSVSLQASSDGPGCGTYGLTDLRRDCRSPRPEPPPSPPDMCAAHLQRIHGTFIHFIGPLRAASQQLLVLCSCCPCAEEPDMLGGGLGTTLSDRSERSIEKYKYKVLRADEQRKH